MGMFCRVTADKRPFKFFQVLLEGAFGHARILSLGYFFHHFSPNECRELIICPVL